MSGAGNGVLGDARVRRKEAGDEIDLSPGCGHDDAKTTGDRQKQEGNVVEETTNQQAVQINTGDEVSRGRYSNSLLVSHGGEEFMLDWLLQSPNGVHLVSRIIVTPAHMKRIVAALQDNISKYEQAFGPIPAAEPLSGPIQ